jgi:hypothetical protein
MGRPFSEVLNMNLPYLLELLGELPTVSSPWAVILVRFQDNKDPLPSMSIYNDLFTSAGKGKQNMVDCFHDMSHGKLDLSGTKIFGWYTLPYNKADYVGNAAPAKGQLDRNGLRDEAKSLATAAGVDLTQFAGVVVSGLGAVDLCGWVGGMAALCDSYSLSPSLLGQEMGHGYGLDHARMQGSTDDYRDPWDVMSTGAYPWMEADNTEFTKVGPGLNAWNMRGRGWLDEARIWTSSSQAFSGSVQLRPLHRTDLPGFLAAQLGDYLVEFRVPQRWDAAIGDACVLVHRFEDNHSYLMPATNGSQSLLTGYKFQIGEPSYQYLPYMVAEVTSIDMDNLTATLNLVLRPRTPLPNIGLVGQIFGGVEVDGGGWIFVNGQFLPVPPRGPVTDLVQQVARFLTVQTYQTGVESALGSQRAALEDIVRSVVSLYRDANAISEPPPGYGAQNQKERNG